MKINIINDRKSYKVSDMKAFQLFLIDLHGPVICFRADGCYYVLSQTNPSPYVISFLDQSKPAFPIRIEGIDIEVISL